jgi:hypothetical protein
MAYRINWYTPHRILLVKLIGEHSLEEFKETNALVTSLLDSATHVVYVLIDASEMTAFPTLPSEILAIGTYAHHNHLSGIVFYGIHNQLFEVMVRIFNKVLDPPVNIVGTLDEALAVVESQDRGQERLL